MRFMWLPIVESVRMYLQSLPEIAETYEVDLIGNLPKGGRAASTSSRATCGASRRFPQA